jgi:hypothetical protein
MVVRSGETGLPNPRLSEVKVRSRFSALAWALMLGAFVALPQVCEAQRDFRDFRGGGGGRGAGRDPSALWGIPDVRSGFYFCRLMFEAVSRDDSGTGWAIEYPRADQNFPTRLAQLTTTQLAYWRYAPPSRNAWDGMPGHTVVQATDPELFMCPWIMMASPGTAGFSEEEVRALREYVLKGGFIWADDFWGNARWAQWEREIGRVLPDYPIVELKPGQNALFETFYSIQAVPQIPSLSAFRRMGYESTSELGAESEYPSMHAIFDENNRPLVLMTHNTDIADGWEREADLEVFFQRFAWQAYAVGVNVMMWIMTR